MNKPNYKDGSIVNLMASIHEAFGNKSVYQPLAGLDDLLISKNIVLIVIDGLGYEYLSRYGKGSFLLNNLKKKITSVFPASTTSALTAFYTGLAAQQHAMPGWYTYLKEAGMVCRILPFTSRAGKFDLKTKGLDYDIVLNTKTVFENMPVKSASITHQSYIDSEYTRVVSKGSSKQSFDTIDGFCQQIYDNIAVKDDERKFILAYWAKFDELCHYHGTDSQIVKAHFHELDQKLKNLASLLHGKDTTIIISADHGLIDIFEQDKIIKLENHKSLEDALAMPLSGDARVAYCYVRPQKTRQFEDYVKTELGHCCELHKSEKLVEDNYFGLFEPHEKLKDRIGDYVLIMKGDYAIKDKIDGEEMMVYKSYHGGMSKEEMFVPLIVIN